MRGEEGGPDRGWSWVVAFAAFFTSLILAGIFRTSGVLFVAFIATFGVTREEAAWPMGVCISVLNFTGPLSGVLGQRYGVRPVVMVGAVIGAIGVSACYFTTSLLVITILFGGVFGIGYGLVSTLMPVIVNAYFLDLRGTANGIANSGSCVGSVILPVLFEFLISSYGLSGCFLLTGGIVLNVAVAGALMRPPSWSASNRQKRTHSEVPLPSSEDKSSNFPKKPQRPSLFRSISDFQKSPDSGKTPFKMVITNCSTKDAEDCQSLDPNSDPMKNLQAELVNTLSKRTMLQETELKDFAEESYDSLDTSASSIFERKDTVQDRLQSELRRAQREFEDTLSDFQSVALEIVETSKSEEVLHHHSDANESRTSELTGNCPARHSFSVSSAKRSPNKFKSPIPSSGPLKKYSFRLRNSSGDSDLYPVRENVYKEDSDPPDGPCPSVEIANEVPKSPRQNLPPETETALPGGESPPGASRTFAVVLSSPMFYVTAFNNVTFFFLFHMYVNVVVDYTLDQGVANEDAKYVLFAFAASDLFGRLCLGWITDRKFVTRSRFVMSGMIGIGVVFFSLPFATDYWSLVLVSCCYGVLLGSTMVIFPILLADLLGMEMHAVAYGCMCFMNGFTSLIRPFIIGYFRDKLCNYHNMFFILGIVSIVASLSWMTEKCFLPKNSSLYEPIEQKTEDA